MEVQKSFKERVKETVINNAASYKWYYVNYEYLLCSKAFIRNEYYIVSAHEDNYLHLTGLHTSLSADDFFEKHDISEVENLITAWEYFTHETAGECFRYEYRGKDIYDIVDYLKDYGLYFAERRER